MHILESNHDFPKFSWTVRCLKISPIAESSENVLHSLLGNSDLLIGTR